MSDDAAGLMRYAELTGDAYLAGVARHRAFLAGSHGEEPADNCEGQDDSDHYTTADAFADMGLDEDDKHYSAADFEADI